MVSDIKLLLLELGNSSCRFIFRQQNVAAHELTRESLSFHYSVKMLEEECPACIASCIDFDA